MELDLHDKAWVSTTINQEELSRKEPRTGCVVSFRRAGKSRFQAFNCHLVASAFLSGWENYFPQFL
jgi:hypothetical protein